MGLGLDTVEFGHPGAFWFFLLVVPILALYGLRRRVRSGVVPYLPLWEAALAQARPRFRIALPRRPLSLLLWLLILALLVTAAAHPYARGRRSVIVLDASGSMTAVESDGTSRFDAARARALDRVNQKAGADEIMVVSAARSIEVLTPFTADATLLRQTIRRAEPTLGSGDIHAAVDFARRLVAENDAIPLYVISDRFEPGPDAGPVIALPVGRTDDNVGIVHFRARRILGVTYLYVQIRNYAAQTRTVAFQIRSLDGPPGSLVPEVPRTLASGEALSQVLEAAGSGTFELKITQPSVDALAADHMAYATIRPTKRQTVVLVSQPERSYFLGAALAGMKEAVELIPTTPEAYARQPIPADLTIFNGLTVTTPVAGNAVYIDCTGPGLPVDVLETSVDRPQVAHWDRGHPINRFVSYGGLNIASARRLRTRARTVALVSHDDGPLITLSEHGGTRAVYVAFDPFPGRSDFPAREGFPIFLANLIAWFDEAARAPDFDVARVGEQIVPAESAIAPLARPVSDAQSLEESGWRPTGLWAIGSLFGIALLLLEWVLYHRGVSE